MVFKTIGKLINWTYNALFCHDYDDEPVSPEEYADQSIRDLDNSYDGITDEIPQITRTEYNVENCPYKVYVSNKTWEKFFIYVRACKSEMGGHLVCEKRNDKIIIKDILLTKQKVSMADYEPDHKDLMKRYPTMIPKIKGWFHSHANGKVFWSGMDEDTIANTVSTLEDFCVSIVMNKKFEYIIRIDILNGNSQETYDGLPLLLYCKKDVELYKKCIKELKTKVKTRLI